MSLSNSGAISPEILRIIDASTNRIGEGLRLLEDVARLILNDVSLTQQLKNLRHELVRSDWPLQQQLLQARDSESDVGTGIEALGMKKRRELPATVVANSRRVQESLRVMEELAKIPGPLSPDKFKQARFALYTIERTLLSKLLRRDRITRLSGLYVIIDTPSLKGRRHTEVAGQAIRGGARVIQLRDKVSTKRELLPIAQELKTLCAERNVLFIINDNLDLALAVDADGLHLGLDDLPTAVARRLLPVGKVLGSSVLNVKQAITAQKDGADYIAVGSIYPTLSKAIKVVGLAGLRRVRQAISLPLVAIGGINQDNVVEVLAAGADSVAVISAVLGAHDVARASRQMTERFKDERTE